MNHEKKIFSLYEQQKIKELREKYSDIIESQDEQDELYGEDEDDDREPYSAYKARMDILSIERKERE